MWTTRSGVRGILLNAKCNNGRTTITTAMSIGDHRSPLNVSAWLELGAEGTCSIGAEHPHLAREEGELLHGVLDRPLVRVTLDICIEHGGVERALELIGL